MGKAIRVNQFRVVGWTQKDVYHGRGHSRQPIHRGCLGLCWIPLSTLLYQLDAVHTCCDSEDALGATGRR